MATAGLPYGLQAMLKEGHRHYAGLEGAVYRNIEACKALAGIVKTSMGPNGMKKIVINHLDKIFVTADAATIVGELEVEHPAARLIVHAAKAAHAEVGDGTNAVVAIAGELLVQAEGLLREGLHTAEVADGYARALAIALASIEALTIPGSADLDVRDAAAVTARLAGPVGAKHAAGVAWLAGLVARACIAVCPVNQTNFNVDNVRVVKVSGGAPDASALVSGLALKRGVEGCVTQAADAKVAVYAQGFDTAGPETKGTVLIRSAAELEAYSGQEEAAVEALVAGVAAAGVNVVVAGGAFGDVALHYLNAAGILALRVPSKFDLRRVCRSTGATALARVEAPTAADVGFAASVGERDVGGTRVVVIEQAGGGDAATGVVSLVLRAPTDALLDELERGADAGVNAYKALTRDARALPAGGAVEAALAARLRADAATAPDLDGVALAAFAAALDVVPRTLAENSGLDATAALAALAAAHAAAPPPAAAGDVADPAAVCRLGLDLAGGPPRDLAAAGGVTDLFSARWWALKLAADAAGTVLRVDQIIMAKPAGGPRAPGGGGDWDED